MSGSRLIGATEAQDMLGIKKTTLYGLMARGEIESVKIGHRRLIPIQAIEAFIEGLRTVAR